MDCKTPNDLLLAAVALDDVEWCGQRFEFYEIPKAVLRNQVIAALPGILKLSLPSGNDIERAISRLGELAGDLMATPVESPTVEKHRMRPLSHLASEQIHQLHRVVRQLVPRLKTAMTKQDLNTVKTLAGEIHEVASANLPRPDTAGTEDFEMVREVFTAFSRVYREWFDRESWMGEGISKASAYYLIDSVAGNAGKKARTEIVLPMMRILAGELVDDEARSAVYTSLAEFEERDGNAS